MKILKKQLINYVETGVHEGYSIYQSLEFGFQKIFGIEKKIRLRKIAKINLKIMIYSYNSCW